MRYLEPTQVGEQSGIAHMLRRWGKGMLPIVFCSTEMTLLL